MKRPPSSWSLVGLLALSASPLGAAWFHPRLIKSSPGKEQQVTTSPTEIRLWFSERIEPTLSTIALQGADSAKVELSKVRKTDDPASIAADVAVSVTPGSYRVSWKTAGRDGHPVRGSFTFSVGK